jgi:hypothetical protein
VRIVRCEAHRDPIDSSPARSRSGQPAARPFAAGAHRGGSITCAAQSERLKGDRRGALCLASSSRSRLVRCAQSTPIATADADGISKARKGGPILVRERAGVGRPPPSLRRSASDIIKEPSGF